jgi:hypothetical protein
MRRIQLYLSFLGSVCALTGALLLLATSLPILSQLQSSAQLPERAVYVGTDACFTCHVDQQDKWSNPLNPRAIDTLVVNPHAVDQDLFANQALPVGSDLGSLAVRAFDAGLGLPFPMTYNFADQYPSSLTLSVEVEEPLR